VVVSVAENRKDAVIAVLLFYWRLLMPMGHHNNIESRASSVVSGRPIFSSNNKFLLTRMRL